MPPNPKVIEEWGGRSEGEIALIQEWSYTTPYMENFEEVTLGDA
jgi:hypothetical protein